MDWLPEKVKYVPTRALPGEEIDVRKYYETKFIDKTKSLAIEDDAVSLASLNIDRKESFDVTQILPFIEQAVNYKSFENRKINPGDERPVQYVPDAVEQVRDNAVELGKQLGRVI